MRGHQAEYMIPVSGEFVHAHAVPNRSSLHSCDPVERHRPHLGLCQRQHLDGGFAGTLPHGFVGSGSLRRKLRHDHLDAPVQCLRQSGCGREPQDAAQSQSRVHCAVAPHDYSLLSMTGASLSLRCKAYCSLLLGPAARATPEISLRSPSMSALMCVNRPVWLPVGWRFPAPAAPCRRPSARHRSPGSRER